MRSKSFAKILEILVYLLTPAGADPEKAGGKFCVGFTLAQCFQFPLYLTDFLTLVLFPTLSDEHYLHFVLIN